MFDYVQDQKVRAVQYHSLLPPSPASSSCCPLPCAAFFFSGSCTLVSDSKLSVSSSPKELFLHHPHLTLVSILAFILNPTSALPTSDVVATFFVPPRHRNLSRRLPPHPHSSAPPTSSCVVCWQCAFDWSQTLQEEAERMLKGNIMSDSVGTVNETDGWHRGRAILSAAS